MLNGPSTTYGPDHIVWRGASVWHTEDGGVQALVANRVDGLSLSHEPGLLGAMQLRYRFRLHPTPAQRPALARAFGCARVVYNDGLRLREEAYRVGCRGCQIVTCCGW